MRRSLPSVPERLPLFPLGLVLLPGLLLPLHVFEPRYRDLVRDLLALPEPERRFGVVAIRSGREVGADGVQALHEVGCVAQLRRVTPYDDGRFDLVTTGTDRFRLHGLVDGTSYLTGAVEWLPDELGAADEAALLDRAVRSAFTAYLAALAAARGAGRAGGRRAARQQPGAVVRRRGQRGGRPRGPPAPARRARRCRAAARRARAAAPRGHPAADPDRGARTRAGALAGQPELTGRSPRRLSTR